MALDKAIEHGKEHRKKYRGGKAADVSCRNGGDCPWCIGNRTAKNRRAVKRAAESISEYRESR